MEGTETDNVATYEEVFTTMFELEEALTKPIRKATVQDGLNTDLLKQGVILFNF